MGAAPRQPCGRTHCGTHFLHPHRPPHPAFPAAPVQAGCWKFRGRRTCRGAAWLYPPLDAYTGILRFHLERACLSLLTQSGRPPPPPQTASRTAPPPCLQAPLCPLQTHARNATRPWKRPLLTQPFVLSPSDRAAHLEHAHLCHLAHDGRVQPLHKRLHHAVGHRLQPSHQLRADGGRFGVNWVG